MGGTDNKTQEQHATPASVRNSMVFGKNEEPFADVKETGNFIVIPPDGGWGWVIVVAAFLSFTFTDGFTYCFGLFMENIAKEYMVSMTMVSITGSLLTAEVYLFGPVFCALINRYTFRLVGLIGAIGTCVCFLCASFAPNYAVFILFMGVLGGMFLSMIYITGCIIVGFYFDKWRALATAISVTGSATGVVVVPLLVGLLDDFTWRMQIRVISGILTITIFAAMTYRSIAPVLVERVSAVNFQSRLHLLEQLNKYNQDMPDYSEDLETMSASNNWYLRMNKRHNLRYPTAAEVQTSGTILISHICPADYRLLRSTNPSWKSENNRIEEDAVQNKGCAANCTWCTKKLRREEQMMYIATRPLYREDIFFHGPLKRLPKYRASMAELSSTDVTANYHMKVTHLAAYQDFLDQQSAKCICCPNAVVRILSTMFDMNLLRNCSFTIFMFSGFFTAAGMFVAFIYVADMNIAAGLGETTSRNLLSAIGFTNIIGRILCGLVSVIPKIKAIIVMEVALTISGIAIILMPFFPNVYAQFICGSIFGLTIACFASLRSIIVVELLGLEKLTNAFGLLLLFQGIAAAIGAPTAGAFMDATGSYDASFYLSGSFILVSAILCYPINYIKRLEKKRALKKPISA